jgi:hypothetical protein
VQFVPPQIHRSNPAEKSVRTSKNQVYAMSPRWDPAFVWPLARAISTPPAPNSASALIIPPPVYYPAPSDLNLDRAGQPLAFSSATRGPHGKEWALADEQELIKLLVSSSASFLSFTPPRPPPI